MSDTANQRLQHCLEGLGVTRETATSVLEGRADGSLSGDRTLALCVLDAPGIKRIVLRSRRPKTRHGASRLLRLWDAALLEREDCAVVFAGGGQAVLLAPLDKASSILARLTTKFQETFDARLATASLPCSPRELVQGPDRAPGLDATELGRLGATAASDGFGDLLSVAQARLRAAKGRDPGASAPQDGTRCDECGVGRGSLRRRYEDREADVCAVCDRLGAGDSPVGELRSFEDLGSAQLAYLAADGTGIGARLAACRSLREYRTLSTALEAAFRWEGEDGLGAWLDKEGVSALPVLAGGDDLLLVMQVGIAGGPLAVATRLAERVRSRFDDAGGGALGLGVGLVVTRALGARQAFDLAEDLVRSAKADRRAGDAAEVAIDFEIFGGGDVLTSLDELRGTRVVEFGSGFGAMRLGQRPFLLGECTELVAIGDSLEGPERSALYAMRDAWLENPLPGLIRAHHTLATDRHSGLAEKLGAAEATPWDLGSSHGLFLRQPPAARAKRTRGRSPKWETAVPDLIDAIRLASLAPVKGAP